MSEQERDLRDLPVTSLARRSGDGDAAVPQRGTAVKDADEITLGEVLGVLRAGRWIIAAVTVGTAALALTGALLLPKQYRASTLVAPVVERGTSSGLASLASSVPGVSNIASMFGLSSHGGDAAKDEATLESQILTRKFIKQNNLLPILYAKLWDPRTGHWRTTDPKRLPTLWKANQLFKHKIRTVALDNKTGLIRLAITWRNPRLAAAWANGLVAMANDYLRARAIREANREIAYLASEARKTSIVTVRQGIYELMQQEIGNEMVAQGKHEYALQVIDPAFAPQAPASPRPILWALSGLIGGLLLSCGGVVFRASLRGSR
jgi:uncharacterized protein involved in exopolysaccharide biosynthesis